MWNHTGQQRPDFADEPSAGQESVWDYPRPPALVPCEVLVQVNAGSLPIAQSTRAMRVLETASPPTVYIPPDDIHMDRLKRADGLSICEWKGAAEYWALATTTGEPVGWSYPRPQPAFAELGGWLCFYPGRIDCYLGGEKVRAQEGGFYGGWVTNNIAGPWKGQPGTGGW